MNVTTSVEMSGQLTKMMKGMKALDKATRQEVWVDTQRIALSMEERIKSDMPVLTGRAKASWGHFTPKDLVGATTMGGKKPTKRTRKFRATSGKDTSVASAADSIWEEDRANLTITQGSRLGYINQLNEGHSRQAAAGFIDAAEAKAQIDAEKMSENLISMISNTLIGGEYRPKSLGGKSVQDMIQRYSEIVNK